MDWSPNFLPLEVFSGLLVISLGVAHYWGFRQFCSGLHGLLGAWGREVLGKLKGGPFKVLGGGVLLGLLTQSLSKEGGFLYGLVNAGLLPFGRGARLLLGACAGPLLLWPLLWKSPLYLGLLLLILSGLVLLTYAFFLPDDDEQNPSFSPLVKISWPKIAEGLLGFALMVLAQGFFISLLKSQAFPLDHLMGFFPQAELSMNLLPMIGEFFRLWLIFLMLFLIFRHGLVPVGLAAGGLAMELWHPIASLALIGSYFFAEAILAQGLSYRINVFGKKLLRLLLIVAFIGLVLDGAFVFFLWWLGEFPLFSSSLTQFCFLFALRLLFVWALTGAFWKKWNTLMRDWVPEKPLHGTYRLKLLGRPADLIPELALIEVRLQVEKLKFQVDRMMVRVKSYVQEGPRARWLGEIKKIESQTDQTYEDVAEFLRSVQMKPLTRRQSLEVQILLNVSYELEKVADYLDKVATYSTRLGEAGAFSEAELKADFWSFWRTVEEYYQGVTSGVVGQLRPVDPQMKQTSKQIKTLAEDLREEHMKIARDRGLSPEQVQNYSDMVVALRKIRGHTYNIFKQLSYLAPLR